VSRPSHLAVKPDLKARGHRRSSRSLVEGLLLRLVRLSHSAFGASLGSWCVWAMTIAISGKTSGRGCFTCSWTGARTDSTSRWHRCPPGLSNGEKEVFAPRELQVCIAEPSFASRLRIFKSRLLLARSATGPTRNGPAVSQHHGRSIRD